MAGQFLGWGLGCVDLGPVWFDDGPPAPVRDRPTGQRPTPQRPTQVELMQAALTRVQALRARTLDGFLRLRRQSPLSQTPRSDDEIVSGQGACVEARPRRHDLANGPGP